MAEPSVSVDNIQVAVNDVTDALSGQANKIQPNTTIKDEGWKYKQKPAVNHFNYIFSWIGKWLKHIVDDVMKGTYTFAGNKTFSGIITNSNTTQSTSKDTGAVVVSGGLGVEKNAYINGGVMPLTGIYPNNVTTGLVGYKIKTFVGELGLWNMQTYTRKTIPLVTTPITHKVISATVTILDDNGGLQGCYSSNLPLTQSGGSFTEPSDDLIRSVTALWVMVVLNNPDPGVTLICTRATGESNQWWNNSLYSSTGVNRGYFYITYLDNA